MKDFKLLAGIWTTEGTHPMVPGVILQGQTSFEWIEDGAFLLMRSELDHRDFPKGTAVFGGDDETQAVSMIYFDDRGVSRIYQSAIENRTWKFWRNSSDFSQRFIARISDDQNTLTSNGEMSKNGGAWEEDLSLTYTRRS